MHTGAFKIFLLHAFENENINICFKPVMYNKNQKRTNRGIQLCQISRRNKDTFSFHLNLCSHVGVMHSFYPEDAKMH